VSEKKAYTPAEFAALFGREKTWSYRMLYAGKIVGISDYGRMMIPASEAARVEADASRYRGKKAAAKKAAKASRKESEPPAQKRGSSQWTAFVAKRRGNKPRGKGMGASSKPAAAAARKSRKAS
jgi:hypothetical protein